MGAGASIEEEIQRPADASDVATPRGESAKREVVRLRALVQAQRAAEAAATGIGAAPPGACFNLEEESYEKDFAEVFPGHVWSVCTAHNPANVAAMPKHNNRCWVIKLADAELGDFLCVYGVPECALAAPKIRAVEQTTGLAVRFSLWEAAAGIICT